MNGQNSSVLKLLRFGSPFFFIYAFIFVFYIGEYIFRVFFFRNYSVPVDTINIVMLINSVIFVCVTILVMIITAFYTSNKIEMNVLNSKETIYPDNTFISNKAIKIALFISMTPLVLLIFLRSNFDLSNSVAMRQALQSGGASYFLIIFQFFYKAFGIYFFERVRYNKFTKLDILIFLFLIVFGFISGFSSLFIYLFLTYWIFSSAKYGERIINIRMILLVVFTIVLAPLYNWYRMLKFTGVNITLDDFWGYLDEYRLLFILKVFDRFDYFDNLISGYVTAQENQNFTYALNLFIQPIPRSMINDKPFNFSSQMTQWVYPENIAMGISANFGFINEFILYFGHFGIFVAFGVFFAICIWATSVFLRSSKNTKVASFYALVLWPYMGAFIIGYWNDMALPALIINLLLFVAFKKYVLQKR